MRASVPSGPRHHASRPMPSPCRRAADARSPAAPSARTSAFTPRTRVVKASQIDTRPFLSKSARHPRSLDEELREHRLVLLRGRIVRGDHDAVPCAASLLKERKAAARRVDEDEPARHAASADRPIRCGAQIGPDQVELGFVPSAPLPWPISSTRTTSSFVARCRRSASAARTFRGSPSDAPANSSSREHEDVILRISELSLQELHELRPPCVVFLRVLRRRRMRRSRSARTARRPRRSAERTTRQHCSSSAQQTREHTSPDDYPALSLCRSAFLHLCVPASARSCVAFVRGRRAFLHSCISAFVHFCVCRALLLSCLSAFRLP